MNTGWLLLFKEDIVALGASIQYALFEEYVKIVFEQGLLLRLDGTSARHVVKSVFLQASSRRFTERNEEQIAERLIEMTEGLAARQPFRAAHIVGENAILPSQLLEAWSDVTSVLQRKRRRRSRARLMISVSSLAIMLLVGGIAFSTEAPAQKAGKEVAASSGEDSDETDESATDVRVHEVKDLKVTADQAKSYANFKMGLPLFLPDGYHFEEARVFLDERKTKSNNIILVYTNEKEHLLRVSYFKLAPRSVLSTGVNMPESTEEVFLRGSKGLLTKTKSNFVQLDWLESDTFISINGREIDGKQLIRMAESLK
ncbi:DUF4367 domain-containing protein [Paenibacillus sp. RC67]|uniref:DUF4367 domain-containing protein n=1 Tax=Paenibacillus sp. RC67 TaxID=3039392 RepID=UPI0024AE2DCF|nr:DUF4367 domain-containing protein [Paenibacillus sp. RC67]